MDSAIVDLNELTRRSGLMITQNALSRRVKGFEWMVVYGQSTVFEGSLQACKGYCKGYLAGLIQAWPKN